MPNSVISTGLADYVLPVEEIPARLMDWAKRLTGPSKAKDRGDDVICHLKRICRVLHQQTGHDFSHYKQGTLIRRTQRRMRMRQVASAADYFNLLDADPKETNELFKDLLIGVTEFFRDHEAFETLAQIVIPRLFENKSEGIPVRVWVAGCASGEEAYSLAILLREQMRDSNRVHPVQIFATDIDEEILAVARQGRFPADIAEHVSPQRLEEFFIKEEAGYRVRPELREMCVFSPHNVVRDPPFSSLDLISCRNLLIYLEADLQQRLVPLFHYALRPGGYLFLGSSEGLAAYPELFKTLDKKHRIFQQNNTVPTPITEFPLIGAGPRPIQLPGAIARRPATREDRRNAGREFEQLILEQFAPAAVLINEQGSALYFSGPTNRYLRQPLGLTNVNLFELAQGSLGVEIRAAVHRAIKTRRPLLRKNVNVEMDGTTRAINLAVRPMSEPGQDVSLLAVVFQDLGEPPRTPEIDEAVPPSEQNVIRQLESELRTAREDLQAVIEELESANEELKGSNEELITTNEELQSANEELQTSKEEVQSTNEELETVNTELNRKVQDLDAAHGDLQNLFAGTQIATIFLDRDLRIKKFTPATTTLFNLRDADAGRPIGDLAPRFIGTDLTADIRQVLASLTPIERQVRLSEDSASFMLRILPYRTIEDQIAGLVVTFVDITDIKRAEDDIRRLAQFPAENPNPVLVLRMTGPCSTPMARQSPCWKL